MRRASRSGSRPIPRFALFALGPLLVLAHIGGGAAAADDVVKSKIVVVLYPDGNDGRPGEVLADRGIRSTFANSPVPVDIYNEHLDVSRFTSPEYQQQLAEFLRHKYAGRKVDLIIAGLASALDFALQYREQAFPGVPIIFCAVDEREVKARKLPPDVIGVPVKMDLAATLDVALRLHPKTERVYAICGKAKFDVEWEAEARRTFRAYENRVKFVYLSGLPLPDLLTQVAELPEHSIVYYVHIFQDGAGAILIPAEALKLIAARANAPIYGHVDTYVGRGIVGGRVISFETAGKNAATLGQRILAGEKPGQIGVQDGEGSVFMFDWHQLRRWGIDRADLPPGSIVHDHEPDFWDLYHWHVLGVISLCIVETLLIVGMLVQRASRRRAEKRFQQAVEAAPNGMLMIGRDGKIVLANPEVERLFGYDKEEMLGQRLELLLPERFRGRHPELRAGFFAAPEARSMGRDREAFGRRKDGTEFPVEVGLSPVQTDAGLCVLASIIDVTERKRAEGVVRESENRFRVMADTAPVLVWMSGPDKLCTYFNKPWLDFTGRSMEQEFGHGWSEGVHPNDLQQCLDTYCCAFDARREFRMEYRLRRFDGVYRWIFDTGVPRFDSTGTFEGYIGSCLDITDQKEAMDALKESQSELRELTGRLLQAQETERRRIARELHDDLNQSLAILAVELDMFRQQPPQSATQVGARIQELLAKVKQLSSTVHDLSHQLHPAKLEQLGLVPAVISFCKELSQTHGLTIAVKHDGVPETLADDTALCLYRITQESLHNVVRHSGARHAAVELTGERDLIHLRITDDGKGFDGNAPDVNGGLGLISMRERLRLVHGALSIDSRPGAGTRIDVRIPLGAAVKISGASHSGRKLPKPSRLRKS
jgi:PAS domain S-box-containing protein